MNTVQDLQSRWISSRRSFLTSMSGGLGAAALMSLLRQEGKCADSERVSPLTPKAAHYAPKAKSCIFINLLGGPSQIDLYDPKPKLQELHGEVLPDSIGKDARFAFVQKKTARLWASPYSFNRCGESGIEVSELLPEIGSCADDITFIRSMHTDAFNHAPGELLMSTGSLLFGRPSVGAWLNYGLGSENENLPGYVVLTTGYGSRAGAASWSSGFLPKAYQGTMFRNRGERVLHLRNPKGICPTVQSNTLESLSKLNAYHQSHVLDPHLEDQIEAYELAYRMQTSVPELFDLRDETETTKNNYGFLRPIPSDLRGWEGGGDLTFDEFSSHCITARRLVERGVRFVNIMHATWDHHMALDKNLRRNCSLIDQPIAALIRDLKDRGLLDSTLVVCAGEFGRTPVGENKLGNMSTSGRDHHPFAFTVWMAGGGIKGGQVIGKTDEIGWNIVESPWHIHDLHATILHLFGLDHERLTYRYQGRDARLTDIAGEVIWSALV